MRELINSVKPARFYTFNKFWYFRWWITFPFGNFSITSKSVSNIKYIENQKKKKKKRKKKKKKKTQQIWKFTYIFLSKFGSVYWGTHFIMLVSFSHTSLIKIGRDGLSIHLCVTEKKGKQKANENKIKMIMQYVSHYPGKLQTN